MEQIGVRAEEPKMVQYAREYEEKVRKAKKEKNDIYGSNSR